MGNKLNRRLKIGMSGRSFRPLILMILLFLLAGCVTMADPEGSQVHADQVVGRVTTEEGLGQTFVSRRPRLNQVELWLRQSDPATAEEVLTVELYHTPQDPAPLVTLPITYPTFSHQPVLTIHLPPRQDPPGQSYYLSLNTNGSPLEVLGRAEDAYANGQMVLGGSPADADLAFRLSYDYDAAATLSDLGKVLANAWLILPLALTLWLPGRLLLAVLVEDRGGTRPQMVGRSEGEEIASPAVRAMTSGEGLDWGERAALSVGLSLAVIPVLMLWTTTLGFKWNRASLLVASALLAATYLIYLWRRSPRRSRQCFMPTWGSQNPEESRKRLAVNAGSLALLAVFLISTVLRLAMVRDLAAPAWVDSVHHATITRLILEQGALPQTYAPLIDLSTASYHPGFHSALAVFLWLSGLDLASGMLWYGQILNGLCVLAVYLFTKAFTSSRAAGVAAGLITGAFTLMPAYYASWGRYTQLAGLLILPVCMVLLQRWMEGRGGLRLLLAAGLACAGLFLTHYRVIAFLICLLAAYLIARSLQCLGKRQFWKSIPGEVGRLGLAGIAAILFSLPWWPAFFIGQAQPYLAGFRGNPKPFADFTWGYLLPANGRPVLILAGLGLVWSILRLRWFGPILALWVALLFLLANPITLGLPKVSFVNNTSVEIMLFIPISALAGYLVGSAVEAGRRLAPLRWRFAYQLTAGIVGAGLAFLGARQLLPILNPVTLLARQADLPAMAWIRENVPEHETVLINPFAWGYGFYGGQDGGFWITPLAGRKTIPPPVLYGMGDWEAAKSINEFCHQVIEKGRDAQALYDLMQSRDVRYVYVGARGGAISAQALRLSPLFDLIYARDGVWLFEAR